MFQLLRKTRYADKFGILLYLFATVFCCRTYSADFELYHRFNLNDNTCSNFFPGLDPEDDIPSEDWISVSGVYHNRTFTATETDNFKQNDDYHKNGIFVRYYLLTNKTFEVIFQWDQVDNTNITTGKTYKASILRNYTRNDDYIFSDDVDIYCFTPKYTAYCIEMDIDSNVNMSISEDGILYVPCVFTNTLEGTVWSQINHKRYYKKDWIRNHKYYIKVCGDENDNDYYLTTHNYQFTIKNVKPIVLVHGIDSNPKNSSDKETAFKDIKNDLPRVDELTPVVVFDFPWNDSEGEYTSYCQDGSQSLSHFINQKCQHLGSKPIIVSHSIGGILTLRQMINDNNVIDQIDKCVFFGIPFCGSDKASWWISKKWSDTSAYNLRCLERGTKHIWGLLSNIPPKFKNNIDSTYFYGTGNKIFVFCYGGTDSDGVVSISSANLPSTLGLSSESIPLKDNHMNMKNISFPCTDDDLLIYNILKTYIDDSANASSSLNFVEPVLKYFGDYNSAIEMRLQDYQDFDYYDLEYMTSELSSHDWTELEIEEGEIENNEAYYHSGIMNYGNPQIFIRIKSEYLGKVSDVHVVDIEASRTTFFKMRISDEVIENEYNFPSKSHDSFLPYYDLEFRLKDIPKPWFNLKLLSPPRHHRDTEGINVTWEHENTNRSGDYILWLTIGSVNNNIIARINVTNLTSYNVNFSDYNMSPGEYWWKISAENDTDDPVESEKRPFHVVSYNHYPDTDEDGYDDYEEYIRHSDPNDSNDIPLIITSNCICPEASINQQYFLKIETSFKDNFGWSYRGKLPSGINLRRDGTLMGLPKELGNFDFTIIVHGSRQKCDQIRMSMEVVTPSASEVIMGAGCYIPEGEEP